MSNQVKNKDKNQSGSEKGWYTYALILDPTGRIKFVTKPLAAKLGYSVSELLSRDAVELFIEDDEKEDRRSQLDFLYKQESVIDAFDLHLKNRKGKSIGLRFSILKLSSENNDTEDIGFIGDDLDSTTKITSSFIGSEAQVAELVDSAKEFIIIIDGDEVVKTINQIGKSKLGVQKGMKFRDLLEPSASKQTTTFLYSLSNISSTSNINLVFVNPKTNQRFNLEGTVSTIVEDTKLQEFRLVLHDITEQVKTEKAKDLYYSIAHYSIHSKNLDELYLNIHRELKQVVDCENLYIALLDNSSDATILNFPYYRDIENKLLNKYQRKFGSGLTEYLLLAKEPKLFTKKDIQKLIKEKKVEIGGTLPETWLGVPLKVQSEIIGVIAIQSYDHRSNYSSRDLKLLDFASSQIAMSINVFRTQEKLKGQTAKLNSIIESSSHLIWTVNEDLELTSFNQNYFDAIINNYDVMPDVQESGSSPLAFDEFWKMKYDQSFSGGKLKFEIQLKDKDGKDIWKEIHLNPIYLDGDKIEEVSGIANDITEKKISEKALTESEEKFRNIYESFQDIYFRCDMYGIVDMVSPSVETLTGLKVDDVIGKNIAQFYKNEAFITSILKKSVQESQIKNFEITIYNTKGEPIECICNLSFNTDSNNKPIYFDGVVRDVTKLKLTNKELTEAKDLAETSLMVKEQFLANMSHEIRTPLNGIIGVIDLLEQTSLVKEQKSYLKTIKASSETLMSILNDILDLSKIEAGMMQLRLTPISPKTIIKKLKSLFASRAASESIKINFHLSDKIPEVIEADEIRLIQIISNLVANSIKFTHRGGSIDIGFELKSDIKNDLIIKVDVRDSGIGIKKEDIDKLFTSFNQLDNSTTKAYGGTGLGLSISKQLVEMMGGEISVYSSPGLGSTFWFNFKAKRSFEKEKKEKKEEYFNAEINNITDITPSILVVDDNLVNRDVAGKILKKAGCNVELASNGIEAVYKATNNNYDIIFMDIQMPEMDGIEANRQIKNLDLNKQPWVIAMTAYSMEEDKERFLSAGLDDYIAKPIKANELVGKVQERISGTINEVLEIEKQDIKLDILNKDTIAQLQKYGGADMVYSALQEFETEANKQLAECNQALLNDDYSTIRKHLHTLKGTAGTLGIEKVAETSKNIEAKIKAEDYSSVKEGLKELSDNFVEFRENFTNIISHY